MARQRQVSLGGTHMRTNRLHYSDSRDVMRLTRKRSLTNRSIPVGGVSSHIFRRVGPEWLRVDTLLLLNLTKGVIIKISSRLRCSRHRPFPRPYLYAVFGPDDSPLCVYEDAEQESFNLLMIRQGKQLCTCL